MENDDAPITDLTLNYRWYQQVKEVNQSVIGNRNSFFIKGPMEKWEGELYCELINNPRLIASKINLLYPIGNPTQGSWESPKKTISKLPKILQKRVRFVDKDLKAHRIARKVLEPIENDIRDDLQKMGDGSRAPNLMSIQAMLRGLIVSIDKSSMFDIEQGLWNLSDFILQVDNKKLSDESKFRLNVIKSYFENYSRESSGFMSFLKPIGPNIAAPEVLEELIKDGEIDDIISERNKIGQIIGLSKLKTKRIYKKIQNFVKSNDRYISPAVKTSGLFLPQGKNIDTVYSGFKSLNMPCGSIPILNLNNSRTYAMLHELKSYNPIYHFVNGGISVSFIHLINKNNFFPLMYHTLTLNEQMKIRNHELTKNPEPLSLQLVPKEK